MILIGVDTGGTFTDLIFRKDGAWDICKLPSTPSNPALAVLEGIQRVAGTGGKRIVHGSTVATNAILERKGVRTALIATGGFEDVIEIGRQNRTGLYDLAYRREPQIVPADLRFGVRERVLCSGEVLAPLLQEEGRELVRELLEAQVESIAVCFLYSYVNPEHEREINDLLRGLNVPVSLSHEILSEFREFERTSTTVVNAYVLPKMQGYISSIGEASGAADSLAIMQSNGGSISAGTAMREPVRTLLSGPAGGVIGALELGKTAGYTRLISFDMGGTSTDVSLIDGKPSFTLESSVSGYPVKVPAIDIHTVGAGGGSIARLDAGGSLKVGPESAGADPGPICYGMGEAITVTDANLFLGRLVPEHFLGGQMRLFAEKVAVSIEEMALEAGLSPVELAEGVLAVANATMEKAIRVISVERGYDPREFDLFSFGGAGGMHAVFLARLLGIPRVIVPRNPGILSALGMLAADVAKDYSLTVMLRDGGDSSQEEAKRALADLQNRARADLLEEGVGEADIFMEEYLDMRYRGQSYEITVPLEGDCIENFHRMHLRTYGYRMDTGPVEIVNARLRARGVTAKPEFPEIPRGSEDPPADALWGRRRIIFDGLAADTGIIKRERLLCGNRIEGPAILTEYSATTVIPPFARAEVDGYGNLAVELDCPREPLSMPAPAASRTRSEA